MRPEHRGSARRSAGRGRGPTQSGNEMNRSIEQPSPGGRWPAYWRSGSRAALKTSAIDTSVLTSQDGGGHSIPCRWKSFSFFTAGENHADRAPADVLIG